MANEITTTLCAPHNRPAPNEIAMANPAPATAPRANNLVTFTGSVTDPQATKIVMKVDPIIKTLAKAFSVAVLNINTSYFHSFIY